MRFFFRYSLIFIFSACALHAQVTKSPLYQPPETRILFIFDASQSMLGVWESDRKINIALKTMYHIIDSLEHVPNLELALRVYGHQSPVPPQDCSDSRLEVPFGKNNASKIRQELSFIRPKGTTPIANSLQMGGGDFPADCPDCRNIIILITDGIEACDGDPCAVSQELQRKGIVLKPFVIGIGIDEGFRQTFDCIGHYYNAANEEKFSEIMELVISQALNATTAQVNLLDINGNPTETNVNMTFYDKNSGKVIYNYVHTLNNRGLPDTLILDHLITYKIRINTIPPVDIDEFKVLPGKHTVIAADCPQGALMIDVEGNHLYRELQIIVRKSGEMNTLNMQSINKPEKYLVGTYDLEIPVLPRIIKKGVKIDQSTTTKVTIPRPGIVNLINNVSGYGSIYLRKNSREEEWVCNLDPSEKNQTLILQPGSYRVVFRATNAKQVLSTISKKFEIKPGGSVAVQLF
jgi:Ca-activated chloride channel homolog